MPTLTRVTSTASLLLALLAALPAAARAQAAPTGRLGPDRTVLEAPRLYTPDRGVARFALAESSYVAVFELAPGRGVRLVYPADDASPERALEPGWHTPALPAGDPFAGQPGNRLDAPAGVRYFYLLAARHPLGLAPGRRSPAAIAASVGLLAFRAADPAEQAGALARHAVTLGREGDWADSPVVAWAPDFTDPAGRTTDGADVRCPDGRVYRVPARTSQPFECPR
jgi:hypothetical protein